MVGPKTYPFSCMCSFSPTRIFEFTQIWMLLYMMIGEYIILPNYYPIVEAVLWLPPPGNMLLLRVADTDSWQISEIIIITFPIYSSFAWDNVKSTEFEFIFIVAWQGPIMHVWVSNRHNDLRLWCCSLWHFRVSAAAAAPGIIPPQPDTRVSSYSISLH